MDKYWTTKEDLVEFYILGNDRDISMQQLFRLHKWANKKKLGCLTWRNLDEWHVGFDRPLTKLMKMNLLVMEDISLWFPLYERRA